MELTSYSGFVRTADIFSPLVENPFSSTETRLAEEQLILLHSSKRGRLLISFLAIYLTIYLAIYLTSIRSMHGRYLL